MSEFLDQSGLSTYSTLVRSSITAARPTVTLVTLKSTGWTNKTQTVTVAGISSDEAAQRIIPIAHADSRSAYNEAGCKGTGQGEGSLTFECETVPSVDLKVWVEVKGVVNKTPPPPPPKIYGVSWDGSSSTTLTRTDDSTNFSNPVAYMSGISNYGSPFDNLMPWSGMVRSIRDCGEVVSIPKFWYKLTQNGMGINIQIADSAVDGFSVCPACMDRGDGKGERDVVYIGRYHCRSSDYKSYGGATPKNNITRSTARSNIHALGSTVWQSDFLMAFTIWLLYIVEYANWNSQEVIGYGCGNNSGVQNMGYTDSMPYHTGTTASARTTYGATTQYRNIEGLWDNCFDWMDGCYYNSNGMMVILNPSAFSDSSGGVLVGKPSDGWISALSVKTVSGLPPLFIASGSSGSDSTYVPDNWYYGASSPCLCRGGDYGQDLYLGMFYVDYNSVSNADANIGCRLLDLGI